MNFKQIKAIEAKKQTTHFKCMQRNKESKRIRAHFPKANEAMIYMADIKQGNKEIEGIKTPYRKLNYILGGLQKGEVTVMAARPGIGKSAILNEIDIYASIRQGKKGCYIQP